MFNKKQKIEKQKQFFENVKTIWENEHAEEVSEAYNEILKIMSALDIYSANMVMNLIYFQTVKKTYEATVGKKDVGGEKQ